MLHINAAERADAVVGRCSLVEPLAERGLFFLCQRIASIPASLIVQPVQALLIVAFHPVLNVASRKIEHQAMLGAVKPWTAKMMIRKRFACTTSFSFFSNRRNVSNVA